MTLLSDLARATSLFQCREIALRMGFAPPEALPPVEQPFTMSVADKASNESKDDE